MINETFDVDDVAEMPPPNPYLIADHPRASAFAEASADRCACGSSPLNPYALTVAELERYYDRDTLELQIRFCKATGRHAQLAVFLEALELQKLLIAADSSGNPHAYLPNYRDVYEEYCRLRVLDVQRTRKQEPGARATGSRANQRGSRENTRGRNRTRLEPQAHLSAEASAKAEARGLARSSRETAKERNTPPGFTECEGENAAAPCRPMGRPQTAGGGSHRKTAPAGIPSPVRGDRRPCGVVPPLTGLEAAPNDPPAHAAGHLRAPQGTQLQSITGEGARATALQGTVPLRLVGQSKIQNLKSKIGRRPLRSRFGLKTFGLTTLAMTGFGGACLRIAA